MYVTQRELRQLLCMCYELIVQRPMIFNKTFYDLYRPRVVDTNQYERMPIQNISQMFI